MVHITLPRSISHLGQKNKDQGPSAGPANGNGGRRPSPPRLVSSISTNTIPDHKPLVLKVYVIKVLTIPLSASSSPLTTAPGPQPSRKGQVWHF